jgi:hypothetical protein
MNQYSLFKKHGEVMYPKTQKRRRKGTTAIRSRP